MPSQRHECRNAQERNGPLKCSEPTVQQVYFSGTVRKITLKKSDGQKLKEEMVVSVEVCGSVYPGVPTGSEVSGVQERCISAVCTVAC